VHNSPLLRSISRIARNRSGGTAFEFALVAPALFMFLMGIVWLAYALWIQNALDFSVAEAARCAANSSACGAPGGQTSNLVTTYAAGVSGASVDSSVFTYVAPANGNCGYGVTASYPMTLAIPFVTLSLTLTSSACFPA
jgi:Flp pilus assembly protein TadG